MNQDIAAYVRDLFFQFREAAAEAQRNSQNRPSEAQHHEGRQMAYVEALLLMQSQADAFMLPRRELGMDGFDPLRDPLAPPQGGRNL